MKHFIIALWCILQNIVGAIVWVVVRLVGVFTRNKEVRTIGYKGTLLTYWPWYSGLCLGQFIFVNSGASQKTIKHEYGHYLDGCCLGPLYLAVIGIPSIIWCGLFEKYRMLNNISYYSFYTEKRANKLGDVDK